MIKPVSPWEVSQAFVLWHHRNLSLHTPLQLRLGSVRDLAGLQFFSYLKISSDYIQVVVSDAHLLGSNAPPLRHSL